MQHCQPIRLGGAADLASPHMPGTMRGARHGALLLVGPRGGGRISAPLARRVLDRLIAPTSQIEGVDFHLSDPALAERARTATAFVLALPPLGNLSNDFYAVHGRRNDRFLCAHPRLKALFPEVDFAPIAFTGHALGTLAHTCPERYAVVRRTLEREWRARMERLLAQLPARGVVLDLPAPPWLRRPSIEIGAVRRLCIDPDDRRTAALALLHALTSGQA